MSSFSEYTVIWNNYDFVLKLNLSQCVWHVFLSVVIFRFERCRFTAIDCNISHSFTEGQISDFEVKFKTCFPLRKEDLQVV